MTLKEENHPLWGFLNAYLKTIYLVIYLEVMPRSGHDPFSR